MERGVAAKRRKDDIIYRKMQSNATRMHAPAIVSSIMAQSGNKQSEKLFTFEHLHVLVVLWVHDCICALQYGEPVPTIVVRNILVCVDQH